MNPAGQKRKAKPAPKAVGRRSFPDQSRAQPGRPTIKTDELVDCILLGVADNRSVREVLAEEGMPARSTWHEWLLDDEPLQKRYAFAKELGAEIEFEEIKLIADTPQEGVKTTVKGEKTETVKGDMVEHRRLQVTARQWRLEKLVPKKYGPRLELDGSVNTGLQILSGEPVSEEAWAEKHGADLGAAAGTASGPH